MIKLLTREPNTYEKNNFGMQHKFQCIVDL